MATAGRHSARAGRRRRLALIAGALAAAFSLHAGAGGDLPSKFTNQGSIANTRHNLTQAGIPGRIFMDAHRNDYEEVCVYCHTPHGANPSVDAPLWNRARSSATYTTYDQLGTSTLTQTVTAPGPNSITCLSCHDGTLAIDSVINMPNQNSLGQTNDNYWPNSPAPPSSAFLNSWQNVSGNNPTDNHAVLGSPDTQSGGPTDVGCMVCHRRGSPFPPAGDFAAFVIGTDLTNDHPIGVNMPNGAGVDFNAPTGVSTGMAFFDDNGDGRANTDEIRLYDTGDGPEVECASCHDPHGVPSGGAGSLFIRSFLRVDNAQSNVCLTCHVK